MSDGGVRDIAAILGMLPHRFPMLMVDRVAELVPGERIRALKAVTVNEPYFPGHFPGRPIMPGVLIVEALAQAAGVLAIESLGLKGSGRLVYFLAIEQAKFRRPVEPGCLLELEVNFLQRRGNVCRFTGAARRDGEVAAEARFTAMVGDPPAAAA
ncbi:MAG: 3-hydroxyacyl-ACP dehydratase FabZ [Sphingomonadaceae bacterium]|uniref:3-hydroxyacyl-ACP dehydratase FabZ n=1 Tax=Thermaurantiacus sp. TaxID=2820283 RepID=UPI00298EE140|nr:3-hydroxyacyl-ACP dehydratase FabZ [Thermaurantiacus sp.]MCS6986547.1 3-hydroxyacyl-ACP dehydratase FabZ [Sphingomonadaceae bacterium]MDW8414192.1 3-hydroxyacyl-ACP dehydratase FabZ [Thermaurantiacus sp.]